MVTKTQGLYALVLFASLSVLLLSSTIDAAWAAPSHANANTNVESPVVISTTAGQITLFWSPSDLQTISKYTINVQCAGNVGNQNMEVPFVSGTAQYSATINGLPSDATCHVQIVITYTDNTPRNPHTLHIIPDGSYTLPPALSLDSVLQDDYEDDVMRALVISPEDLSNAAHYIIQYECNNYDTKQFKGEFDSEDGFTLAFIENTPTIDPATCDFKIKSVAKDGIVPGPWSETIRGGAAFVSTASISPPTNLKFAEGMDNVVISWDASVLVSDVQFGWGPVTYEITLQGASLMDRSFSTTDTSYTIDSLTPGVTYSVSINAKAQKYDKVFGSYVVDFVTTPGTSSDFTTTPNTSPPQVPAAAADASPPQVPAAAADDADASLLPVVNNLHAERTAPSQVTLTWDEPTNLEKIILYYSITYRCGGADTDFIVGADQKFISIDNLYTINSCYFVVIPMFDDGTHGGAIRIAMEPLETLPVNSPPDASCHSGKVKAVAVMTCTLNEPSVEPPLDNTPSTDSDTPSTDTDSDTPKDHKKKRSTGSSNEHYKKPTFGMSHLTESLIVNNGMCLNDSCVDVVSWHTEYPEDKILIDTTNYLQAKVYTDNTLRYVEFFFGVPRAGDASNAEVFVKASLSRNYTSPNNYDVTGISTTDAEGLLDGTVTAATVQPSKCLSADAEPNCHTVTLQFDFNEAPIHRAFAIAAVDMDRRVHTNYFNEGFVVLGESLNPADMHHVANSGKYHSNEYASTHQLTLTQTDRANNLWADQWGFAWTQNDHGTWLQLERDEFVRYQDDISSVMTRANSNYDSMISHERDRALQHAKNMYGSIYDRPSSDLAEPVTIWIVPSPTNKLQNPEILDAMKLEETKAMRYLQHIVRADVLRE